MVSSKMESSVAADMESQVTLNGEEESEREGEKRVSANVDWEGFQLYLVL